MITLSVESNVFLAILVMSSSDGVLPPSSSKAFFKISEGMGDKMHPQVNLVFSAQVPDTLVKTKCMCILILNSNLFPFTKAIALLLNS